jgi:phage terminase large subunit GpA-like protein
VARREARLACPHCGSLIEDRQKAGMNARGVYVAPGQKITREGDLVGELEPNDHWSFWVSGLASPWKSWGQRASDFVTVSRSGDPGRVQGVLNTGFGELYRVGGDAPEWQDVRKRAGTYNSGEVPADGLWLTCGVDVQKDRLIYSVRAWGYGLESWLIEFGELWGDTSSTDVWTRLRDDVLGREFSGLTIRRAVIDSGYKPGEESSDHIVYRFCRESGGLAVPSKGHDTQSKPLHAAQIDVRVDGRVIKRGLQLWHLDSDFFKSFVHGRLRQPVDQPGGWHLPQDVTEDYCQQVVAEARATKASGRAIWVRVRKDNHALDCEAMNVAAAHMLGAHMMRRPEPPPTPQPGAPAPVAPAAARRPIGRNTWATNWRR